MHNHKLYNSKTLDGYIYRARLELQAWLIQQLSAYAYSVAWQRLGTVKPTLPDWVDDGIEEDPDDSF